MSSITLTLSQIETSGLQVRVSTDRGHVDDLVELFGDCGEWPPTLPPLTVFGRIGDAGFYLADGHHRYQAAQEAGCTEVPVDLRPGDKQDALRFACGANSGHGLKRTPADRRNAIITLYDMDRGMSQRRIAELCRVSEERVRHYLGEYKKSLAAVSTARSTQSEPAADHATETNCVDRAVETPEAVAASNCVDRAVETAPSAAANCVDRAVEPAPDVRVCKDGRKRDVSRIGKRKGTAPDKGAPVDGAGYPLTPAIASAFVTALEIDAITKDLRAVQRRISEIAAEPGCEIIRSRRRCEIKDGAERWRSNDVQNAIAELQHGRPHAVCPQCRETIKPACDLCQGLGWVTEATWGRTPERIKVAPAA